MRQPVRFQQEAPIENEWLKTAPPIPEEEKPDSGAIQWINDRKAQRKLRDLARKPKERAKRAKLREEIKKTRGRMQITADCHNKFLFFPEIDSSRTTNSGAMWRIRAYNVDDGNLSFLDERYFETQEECLKEIAKMQRADDKGFKRVLKHAAGWGHWRLEQLACGHKVLLTSSKGYVHEALSRLCVECQKDGERSVSGAQLRALRIVRY